MFSKNRKLNKFATTNSIYEKINYFRHASSHSVHVCQFSAKSGLYRSVKTVHTKLFVKKIVSCINMQLPIVFMKESIISDKHHRIA